MCSALCVLPFRPMFPWYACLQECRLLWRMAHPNVVQFYGACVSGMCVVPHVKSEASVPSVP